MFDLEVWLTGTPAELDAAARALASIGHVLYHGARHPLVGTDAGRYRTYAQIRVHSQPTTRPGHVDAAPALTGPAA